MFTFADIVKLTQRDMQALWRHLDVKRVALALRGASEEIRQKFLSAQSTRNQQALLEEIELLGPRRQSEVQEAQEEIVGVVRRLVEREEIRVPRDEPLI
jgi:flagellar motor switch protein FliG